MSFGVLLAVGPIKAEVYLKDCEVVSGELPAELDGMYMRNGSNPYYEPYASYHWFEGTAELGAEYAIPVVLWL